MSQVKNKCCLIYNFPQHYRASVFKQMDDKLNFDFYFGDHLYWAPDIKEFDVHQLKGFKARVKNVRIFFGKFTWQKNTVKLVFKDYRHFILFGDPTYLSNWIIMLLCKLLRKKTYLWMHGLNGDLNFKDKLLAYSFYHLADKLLLYSDYSKKIMIKKGFNEKKIACIYNSLDYETQLHIRKNITKSNIYKDHFQNDLPVIIYIGRIQKSKKIHLIIEAMALLRARSIYCNLVIVGADKENVNLNEIVAANSFGKNTWFYGPCYDESQIGELIYNADVCVSPGNVGLTVMHCFVYGTPVITHGNFQNQGPEFEAIQAGINGDFFEEDNVEDLGRKIESWISQDDIKREKVRLSAYKIIDERYNPGYQIEVLKKVLANE